MSGGILWSFDAKLSEENLSSSICQISLDTLNLKSIIYQYILLTYFNFSKIFFKIFLEFPWGFIKLIWQQKNFKIV